jgi:uroporphyrinogen-III synthase
MSKRLFISKNNSESLDLSISLSSYKTELIMHSFLHFKAIEFKVDAPYDIIFFTSPRAVRFFKAQLDIPRGVKIACTGSKTADSLSALGCQVDFQGEKSGDIQQVAAKFKTWAKDKRVLFPISDISLRTISSQLNLNSVIEVEVYKTILRGMRVDPCDIYVFTSPSNVAGFLIENKVPIEARIIAWGTSTQNALIQKGFKVEHTMKESSIKSLIDYLYQKKPVKD